MLVIDVATGSAKLLTPPDVAVHNLLWSPDGRLLAFAHDVPNGHVLAVINADGTGMHDLAGLEGLDVNGPDSWSPDDQWIYFGAGDAHGEHVFRVNVPHGYAKQLSGARQSSPGISASPDGTMILFNVDAGYGFDSWIANSDGTGARLLLRSGGIGSWSPDSALIVLNWRPAEAVGGLVTMRRDGTGMTILVPFDASCRDGWDQTCTLGYAWGVPRP
jgi:Tol biopolymer transport system component